MASRLGACISLFLLIACSAWAQLSSAKRLSVEDETEFRRELERLGSLLSTANDKAAVELQIANTYAAGEQYAEAFGLLRQLVNGGYGFDPSRDPDFAGLRNTKEFQSIMEEVRRQTPAVLNSHLIATIDEQNLFPESFAFDSRQRSFFLGSTVRDEIVRCPVGKACVPFVTPRRGEQGYVLGLKIDNVSDRVWAATNTQAPGSVMH